MGKLAIVVHGGAGPDSEHIKQNMEGYKKGLGEAVNTGYKILEEGGSALDAVEAAVRYLEDDPLFNAGKGAALNERAEVEMGSSIMNGKNMQSGAVAIVKNVKNPVSLAKAVMEKTKHIYLGGKGALDFAQQIQAPIELDAYFITQYQYQMYDEKRKEEKGSDQAAAKNEANERMHGTVGAVALDKEGNLAAATSTGGTEYCKEGRIADSSMVGIGTYANNKTCAVSTTGDGEYLMKHVTAFHISALIEYKGLTLKEACHYLIKEKCKDEEGDMGLIAVDPQGNVALEFNSDRMHRAWKRGNEETVVKIYNE